MSGPHSLTAWARRPGAFLSAATFLVSVIMFVRNLIAAAGVNDYGRPVALLAFGILMAQADSIKQQLLSTQEELALLRDSSPSVITYRSQKSFYSELRKAVEKAEDCVRATYFRTVPPTKLEPEAREYFKACTDWAAEDSDRRLMRIMCKPRTSEMKEWARQQNNLAARLGGLRYVLRTFDSAGVDPLSIAIIDEKTVFCAFTDEGTVRGFSVVSPDLAKYFAEYHRKQFEAGEDIC
ncbi:hypothetical protein ACWDAO_12350 [Streptomyces sp. NPDC001212]|uniref:hypothetical protein n=1 Tax=Streptomyces sp. HYC2 TaxID=2955207 RepID=UPI0024814348|nr:hypothetical protein [Streptomyces sp. HYC2]